MLRVALASVPPADAETALNPLALIRVHSRVATDKQARTAKKTVIESIESTVDLEKCPRLCHPCPRMWNRSHSERNGRPGRLIRQRGLRRPRPVCRRSERLNPSGQLGHLEKLLRQTPFRPARQIPVLAQTLSEAAREPPNSPRPPMPSSTQESVTSSRLFKPLKAS